MFDYQNTRRIGDVGEAYAIAKFTQAGFIVSKPLSENSPYDFIVDYNHKLTKIQVKTTEKVKNGKDMEFELSRTNGFKCINKIYTPEEIDFYFLYCIENGWCGLINVSEVTKSGAVNIHMDFAKSCQQYKYKMHYDYEFANKLPEIVDGVKVPFKDRTEQIEEFKARRNAEKEKKNSEKPPVNNIEGKTTRETLKEQIRFIPFKQIGRLYGVSDNTIRKWCKKMNLPHRVTDIETYSDEEWEQI